MDLSQDDLTSVRQEVLHELILRQPNPGSPQKSYMDLAQDNLTPVHQEVLHELTSPSNPTQVLPFQKKRSFTRTHHQSNPTQVPSPFQIQFYTNSSACNPT